MDSSMVSTTPRISSLGTGGTSMRLRKFCKMKIAVLRFPGGGGRGEVTTLSTPPHGSTIQAGLEVMVLCPTNVLQRGPSKPLLGNPLWPLILVCGGISGERCPPLHRLPLSWTRTIPTLTVLPTPSKCPSTTPHTTVSAVTWHLFSHQEPLNSSYTTRTSISYGMYGKGSLMITWLLMGHSTHSAQCPTQLETPPLPLSSNLRKVRSDTSTSNLTPKEGVTTTPGPSVCGYKSIKRNFL